MSLVLLLNDAVLVIKGKHFFDILQLFFKLLLSLEQLLNKLIFAVNFFFENIDHEVFGCQHILQVASECIETMVGVPLCLLFVDRHATLVARVSSLAAVRFMLHNLQPFYFLMAVDTWNHNVGAGCLVQINFLPKALCATFFEGLALYGLIVTRDIVLLHLSVGHCETTAEIYVFALELHRCQLFFDLFFN